MNTLRKILAIWVGKFVIKISKLLGKKGSSMPGYIALKIYPSILSDLSSKVKNDIIVICGTNGKTTTNNMLYDLLKFKDYKVVCNNVGANMLEGVTCAFISYANFFGRIDADFACLEIDEASTLKVFEHLKPDLFVLTNLFRDQLDRYGEIDITMDILKRALKKVEGVKLLLNGDDPLTSSFGFNSSNFDTEHCKFFGINQDMKSSLNETKEGRFCTSCGEELSYDYYHYSQLGKYTCKNCSFTRPNLDYKATDINLHDNLSFNLEFENNNVLINMNYKGFYNIYNIMAAFAVTQIIGINNLDINSILSKYKPQIGRMETFFLGKPVVLNLSKNPAGFNQAISTVIDDKRSKDIMVVINDNAQDGKDISWIWDVDFERLNTNNHFSFTSSGIRRDDLYIRFKYAGINTPVKKMDNLKSAIIDTVRRTGEVCYILVNYTALFKIQDILKELENNWSKEIADYEQPNVKM